MSISKVVAAARRRYRRVSPLEAAAMAASDAVIVDTRCGDQRRAHGIIPGSIHVPLSVLPWRADPDSGHDDPRVSSGGRELILICQDGYSSTLAVATLLDAGRDRVTDVAGGYEAWRAAGLAVTDADAGSLSDSERSQSSQVWNGLESQAEVPQRL